MSDPKRNPWEMLTAPPRSFTRPERRESVEASEHDGGAGVIEVEDPETGDARRCYVVD